MQTVVYHLIGHPGVGKYTVGRSLAQLTGARLVDNHSWANALFNLLDQDGIKPLPDAIWPRVLEVRRVVLDTIANVSPLEMSFILTNYIRGKDRAEYTLFQDTVDVAGARGSLFLPVVLTCSTAELMNRIVDPSRAQRMKLIDPNEARRLNEEVPQFITDHPHALRLDVTNLAPGAAARRIYDRARHLCAP